MLEFVGEQAVKAWGILLAICGGLWLLYALGMDTSVPTGLGGRVQNIGLLADKQNYIMISCLMLAVGIGMAVIGSRNDASAAAPTQQSINKPPCERNLELDEYRLWLADRYAVSRNDLFDRFVCQGKTFETLDEALRHADSLEAEPKVEDLESIEQRLAELDVEEERQTRFVRAIAIVFLVVVVLYAIL